MTVQTTYAIEHNELIAGMMRSFQPHNTISKINKGAAVIPYGKGVVTDGDDGAKLPEAGSLANQFNGVVMYELNRAQQDGEVAGGQPEQLMTVVAHGQVAVNAIDSVAKDDPVYLRVGATSNGDFTNAVGTGATLGVLIEGAKWVTTTAAGEIGFISLGIGG